LLWDLDFTILGSLGAPLPTYFERRGSGENARRASCGDESQGLAVEESP
jgi:hypothetical protein